MPKSRIRTKRGKSKFISHADQKKIDAAYSKKFDEFDKMELEQLEQLFKSNIVKGTYAVALKSVIDIKKMQPLKQEKAA